jgi:DNA modification methylase
MRRPIVNNSSRGEVIYEPFGGSGSTIIAADSVRRRCVAIELDPRYCDVIIERWQTYTGAKAILDGGGAFEELKMVRAAQ